jgi:hypothetical protein
LQVAGFVRRSLVNLQPCNLQLLPPEKRMRGERPKEIGLSASGFCSESNPSPGTKISTPEFGYGLFVARHFCRMIAGKLQLKVIHQPSTAC